MKSWIKLRITSRFALAGIAAFIVLISCHRAGVSPKSAATHFLDAMAAQNFEYALTLCTDSTVHKLSAFIREAESEDHIFREDYMIMSVIEIEEEKEAMVHYLFDDDTISRQLMVKKQFKNWKVHYVRTDPLGVAAEFLDAFHQRKFEDAKGFVTPEAKKDLDLVIRRADDLDIADSARVLDIVFNNDRTRAIVAYSENNQADSLKLNLVLTNLGWKVTFSKFNEFNS